MGPDQSALGVTGPVAPELSSGLNSCGALGLTTGTLLLSRLAFAWVSALLKLAPTSAAFALAFDSALFFAAAAAAGVSAGALLGRCCSPEDAIAKQYPIYLLVICAYFTRFICWLLLRPLADVFFCVC
jgi:hypothetical protein